MKTDNSHVTRMFREGSAIDRALRRAVQKALWEHKQLGHPIVIWRDGKVVCVPPEEIRVDWPEQAPPPDA